VAAAIERFLGRTGINVMTRVMVLIIAAIGVNFMTGIRRNCRIARIGRPMRWAALFCPAEPCLALSESGHYEEHAAPRRARRSATNYCH
jgi:multiple antibiotic resistance protein